MTTLNLEPNPPKMPPVRVVFESAARSMAVDVLSPCALVVFRMDTDEQGTYRLYEQHGPPMELAEMVQIILRFAIANGLADLVFRGLVAGPTRATSVTRTVPPAAPVTPPPDDELPDDLQRRLDR